MEIKGKLTVEKLNTVLDEVQNRCRERTVTAQQIMDALDDITKTLNIPKKAMEGVSVSIDLNAQHFPRAYKYEPMSTIVEAIYGKGKWSVVRIYRGKTRVPSKRYLVAHTENSKTALVNRFSSFEFTR